MPDRASTPCYDKCTSCAFASKRGSVYEPWPKSHTEVCCLYKFNQQGHSALCLKDVGRKPNDTCDGLCKDCPTRLKYRQLQVEVPIQPDPPQTSSDVAQEGITDVPPSCTSTHSGTGKRSKIAPRKRRGFSKLTIEIRPPRFKKKLWFGTWTAEEIDRARDAINFYMGGNEPYILPDSPMIFAKHPLGIEYRQLEPSCEEHIQVGQKRVRASAYFARQVKEVIKAVTRGKKKVPPAKKSQKCKVGASRAPHAEYEKREPPQKIEPLMSGSSGSPSSIIFGASASASSSIMPCASGSPDSPADDNMICSEANSELAPVNSSIFLPSPEMLPYEEELPIGSELFRSFDLDEEMFSLEGITFSSSSSGGAPLGYCEGGMMEDNCFLPFLWVLNEDRMSL